MNHSFIKLLGRLLLLAELARHEQTGERGLKQTLEKLDGSHSDTQSAVKNLELFLTVLSDEERKDVVGLYGLGRWAFDSFADARENSGHADKIIPYILASRTDLHDSVINGLKRLAVLPPEAINHAEAAVP
jgi:hypothetical protein